MGNKSVWAREFAMNKQPWIIEGGWFGNSNLYVGKLMGISPVPPREGRDSLT